MNTFNRFTHHLTQFVVAVVLALGVFLTMQLNTQADTGRPSGIVIGIITPGNGPAAPAQRPVRRPPEVVVDSIDHIMPGQTPTQSPNPDQPPVCDTPQPGCRNVVSTGTEPIIPNNPPLAVNGPAGASAPTTTPKPAGVPIRIIRLGH